MKIKVNKHKLNMHYRGSPWGSRTQQHAYCLRYAHSHHIESHLGKKQPQAKIAIAFLFGQLHFNNVASHALFYGGHLVMRRKRCAVQNQGITLSSLSRESNFTFLENWQNPTIQRLYNSEFFEKYVESHGATGLFCPQTLKGVFPHSLRRKSTLLNCCEII